MAFAARITSFFLAIHLLVATSGVPVMWRYCGDKVASVAPALGAVQDGICDAAHGGEETPISSCCASDDENNAGIECETMAECPIAGASECRYHEELRIERLQADFLKTETRSADVEHYRFVVAVLPPPKRLCAAQSVMPLSALSYAQSLPPPDIPVLVRSLLI